MRTVARDAVEPRGMALALIAAFGVYAVQRDWRIALAGAVGVLGVKFGARAMVARSVRRQPIPSLPLPHLTPDEGLVAFGVWRGLPDEAIAEHLEIPVDRVERTIKRIAVKWHARSRTAIRHRVIEIVGDPPHRKEPWEWIAELGLGLAIATVGLTVLLAASDTPLIGSLRDWLGLGLIGVGAGFCVNSTVGYLSERIPR